MLTTAMDAGADLDARATQLVYAAAPRGTVRATLGTEATLRLQLASLLLRHGANVNSTDDYEYSTLLHAAASFCPSSMVRLLVKAGAGG